MKINFLKFKKGFAKESFSVNPNTYFRFVILIASAVILVGFGFGFYAFKEFDKESIQNSNEIDQTLELSKKERIEEILKYFVERERKSIEIINNPAPVIDPSS